MSIAQPLTVVSAREFPVSREVLFRNFSNPAQLSQWWGPKGFTNTFEKFDLRPGGEWRFVMHGPNGANYPNHKEFVEVIAPERVVYKHFQPMHTFTMAITFEALSPTRSQMTWRMDFVASEQNANLKDFIVTANEENFDRLTEHLKSQSHV